MTYVIEKKDAEALAAAIEVRRPQFHKDDFASTRQGYAVANYLHRHGWDFSIDGNTGRKTLTRQES